MGEFCKICNKEYTALQTHLKTKHQMSQEDYDQLQLEDLDVEPDTTVKMEKVEEKDDTNLQKGALADEIANEITLLDYLNQNKMSKVELDLVVKAYKDGKPISGVMGQKVRQDRAEVDAKALSNEKSVKTTNLIIAEELRKKYGFKVITVKAAVPNVSPKIWILEKK